ncbi:MAG: nuclease [Planctomycetes bacterium]|nr:nuclease [Planctomycetota bacterium]
MPIQHAIWTVGAEPKPVPLTRLASERLLEDMIRSDSRILSAEWMLIGRQEVTSFGGRIDLIAIAPDGSLVLIELKRDRTPREIVAQALDYASWIAELSSDRVAQIYQRFSNGGNLSEAFRSRFGKELDDETLNESHQIVIVAAELDDSTERIVSYLNERDIAINVMFFQVFELDGRQLLSRAWLIDPGETQANVAATTKSKGEKGEKEPWNGEFYVSYGGRSWADAVKYGFVSAGGGSWYSQTLKQLAPGDRIWVKIPKSGYVGVGRVLEAVQPATEFMVETPQGPRSILDVSEHAEALRRHASDPEMSEYFVRVKWLSTVPESDAFDEVGLFGLQHTVCRPTTPKWRHTVERLKTKFVGWDRE